VPSVFATRFFDVASPRFKELLGEVVSISRGEATTVGVIASWIREGSEIQTQTRMGVKTSFIDREWLIIKTAYLIEGSAVTPAAGDRLTDADGVVWEGMSQPNMPAVESYGGGLEWLLRTKRISVT
jgi:hypothetical protein